MALLLFKRSGLRLHNESTPEISVGVVKEARGQGIGSLLLEALIDEARDRDFHALSLSVEATNRAASLYRRLGFVTVGRVGGSETMVLNLSGECPGSPAPHHP